MRVLILWMVALLGLIASPTVAAEKERQVQMMLCPGLANGSWMKLEKVLTDGTRADCVTKDYAVEVDFTDHWHQAIGQALHYAAMLKIRPGVILVCRSDTGISHCLEQREHFDETISYWNIGMMLWYCPTGVQRLSDCEVKDYFGPD